MDVLDEITCFMNDAYYSSDSYQKVSNLFIQH